MLSTSNVIVFKTSHLLRPPYKNHSLLLSLWTCGIYCNHERVIRIRTIETDYAPALHSLLANLAQISNSLIFIIPLNSRFVIIAACLVEMLPTYALHGHIDNQKPISLRPCETGKFPLRPYRNDYGNWRLKWND